MPGYFIHEAVGNACSNKLKINNASDKEAFLIGTVIPDVAKAEKRFTSNSEEIKKLREMENKAHFYYNSNRTFDMPNVKDFVSKYKDFESDDFKLGYLCHLLADVNFFIALFNHITLIDKDDNEYTIKSKEMVIDPYECLSAQPVWNDVKAIKINRTGEVVGLDTFFSEEYLYGDYTKLNGIVAKHYDVSILKECNIESTVDEVSTEHYGLIVEELMGYIEEAKGLTDLTPRVVTVEFIDEFIEDFSEFFVKAIDELGVSLT